MIDYDFFTDDKDLVLLYFGNVYALTDYPRLGYRVRLCSIGHGWQPIFKSHIMAYCSLEGMVHFIDKYFLMIVDCNDRIFKCDEFILFIKKVMESERKSPLLVSEFTPLNLYTWKDGCCVTDVDYG